jgi:hypothetical protein
MPQLAVSPILITMLNQTIGLAPMMEAVPETDRDTQKSLGFITPFGTLYIKIHPDTESYGMKLMALITSFSLTIKLLYVVQMIKQYVGMFDETRRPEYPHPYPGGGAKSPGRTSSPAK